MNLMPTELKQVQVKYGRFKAETYALGTDEDFLYSKYSAYIHVMKTGMIPSKKDTWDMITKL